MSSEAKMPLLGDKFPELKVVTTRGVKQLPADYKGQWFVLFSHPADFTPVCTTEFVAFQKRYDKFKALGCELIGLSVDQVFSHIKWAEWIKEKLGVEIEFPIIAGDGKVASTLGITHPGKGSNTVRAVFVVDPEGTIRIILYYPQELGRNIDEILRAVKAMQVSDKHNVAMPAQWPDSEVVGKDHVIIPPAKDVNTARQRLRDAKRREVPEPGLVALPQRAEGRLIRRTGANERHGKGTDRHGPPPSAPGIGIDRSQSVFFRQFKVEGLGRYSYLIGCPRGSSSPFCNGATGRGGN